MPKVTFIDFKGSEKHVSGQDGESLLQLAHSNGIEGVIGECGGNLSCATCHVYVDEAWLGLLPPPSGDENAMLDGTYCDRMSNSRLGCQIKLGPSLEGLVVRLPERQT